MMSLRSAFFMSFFIIDPAGFQLVEPTVLREATLNLQFSITGICDLLKPSLLYNIL